MNESTHDSAIMRSLRGWRIRLDEEIEREYVLPRELTVSVALDRYMVDNTKMTDLCGHLVRSMSTQLAAELERRLKIRCRRTTYGYHLTSSLFVFDRDQLATFIRQIREEERKSCLSTVSSSARR